MFVDELGRLPDRVEEDCEGVEPSNHAAELDSSDEVDRDADVLFAYLIQKNVLQVELRFIQFESSGSL